VSIGMTNLRNEGPIGVFDSGLAGLTVVRTLIERLPHEDIVYLGDTARLPYGTRGRQTILNYSHACASVLREQRIKLLVIACNTVSAIAQQQLAAELFMPVIGTVLPGAAAAVSVSKNKHIGVLASTRTTLSGVYPRAITALAHDAKVFVQKSPLLVSLVEEAWLDGDVPRLAVREYVTPLVQRGIDVLVLGCSQYPLLEPLITRELAGLHDKPIALVDSAHAAASEVVHTIETRHLATERTDAGKLRIVVTDMPEDLKMASRYLGRDLSAFPISAIDL
jgi:glutamate racemase